jgi:nucleoside-diphosphate-sugar epimerase
MVRGVGMKLFIVGITGVLGHALLPLLTQRGDTVRTLARKSEQVQSLTLAGVEAFVGDLLAQEIVAQLPTMVRGCDAVLHIATAIPHSEGAAASHAWEITGRLRTDGTRVLLQAALDSGVQRYIQQSIVMAYPDSGDQWIDESTPLDSSPAREAIVRPVRTMEQMVRATAIDRLQWCILRGGAFVGPDTMQDNQIASLRSGRLSIPCDGNNYLSLVHIADMATAIVQTLDSAPAGSTFNIVDDPVRNGDYLDHLADMLGVPHAARIPTHPCPPSYRCSNKAARSTLNWTPIEGIWPSITHSL